MKTTEMILPAAKQVRTYAEKLLKDITAEQFARKPIIHGQLIEINHPAFVYGHLSIYPVQLASMVGLDPTSMVVPETYAPLFKIDTPCHDDKEGNIYPNMREITKAFFQATDSLLELVPTIDESHFLAPLADPNRQSRFGSVGAFFMYLLLAHPQVHLGQISSWRRCMGLGSV